MLETDADRLAAIKSLGGLLWTHARGTLWAIFDNEYIEVPDARGIESRSPALTAVRESDLNRVDLKKEDQLTAGALTYYVRTIKFDGTGSAVVTLKK
jgi:hypothetical protein